MLPEQLENKLQIVGSERERKTGNIEMWFCKTNDAQKSIFYERVKTYNTLL